MRLYTTTEVLDALRRVPGATTAEVAALVGSSAPTAHRRLNELERDCAAMRTRYGRSDHWRAITTISSDLGRSVITRLLARDVETRAATRAAA